MKKNIAKRLGKIFITAYQALFYGSATRASCRFEPSCSEYTKEAIDKHGLTKGSVLGTKRILRCHPWSQCGFDPVPDQFTWQDRV